MNENDILNEIGILKKLDHPNIVKIYECFNSENYYNIITEYCREGELFDYIKKFGAFKETQASYIFYQLLSAVYFCHNMKILHRDLKPENILIESIRKNDDHMLNIKVIDFGTAKIFEKHKTENTKIGSSYYMAPEVLEKNYTEKCDLWSCGVILYILLTSKPPFPGNTDEQIFERIKIGKYNVIDTVLYSCTSECKDLISKLLEMDPNKRVSAEKALKHKWFDKMRTKEILFPTTKLNLQLSFKKLANHKKGLKLQSAAMALIVHNMPFNDEIRNILSVFRSIDENGDGRITKDELLNGMKIYNKNIQNPEEIVNKIFSTIDGDNNGYLEFQEFTRVLIDKKNLMTKDILKFSFDFFDKDGNGEITEAELEDILGKGNSEKLRVVFDEVDLDKNGKITFEEFEQMMVKILDENEE